ncbi:MAG TPA: DNA-binding domain-containing protein [Acidisarcina sp.]
MSAGAPSGNATSLVDEASVAFPLKSLQRRMAAAVMEPLTRTETTVRRRRDGVDVAREAAAFVKPNDRLTSFERLEIYNRQYWFRLYASFEEDFPGLQAVLGRAKFEGLMRQYLAECPSTSFTLRNLGSKLLEWLVAHPEWTGGTDTSLSTLSLDMVRIEWAHIEAFDEAAEPAPTADDFAAVTDETRFRLQPHLKLLRLHFPVDDLLIAVRNDTGSGDATSNNAKVARRSKVVRRITKMEPEEIFLAVHRRENTVYYKRLHPEDYRMLEVLSGGATLEAAITAGFEGSEIPEEDRPPFLQQAFQTWAELGWFVK